MPRERLAPGLHGRITVVERVVVVAGAAGRQTRRTLWVAATYVRDSDGKRRRVERSSEKSAEDADRALQRHLKVRRTPVVGGQAVNPKTTLAELFELWITAKIAEDGLSATSAGQYRQVWRAHGVAQLGALRIGELSTSSANAYLMGMGASTQAKRLRIILSGMFGMAVRFDVLSVNPIRETKTTKTTRKPPRAATAAEFARIRVWRPRSTWHATGRVRATVRRVCYRRSSNARPRPARGRTKSLPSSGRTSTCSRIHPR